MSTITTSPSCVTELTENFQAIAGKTLGAIAAEYNIAIPASLHHTKGWVGQLIELALGASAGNQALPDFPHLGIELKTIPLNAKGQPMESTYICTAPLHDTNTIWEQSNVYQKIRHILWVPIYSASTDLAARQIATPFLWQPDQLQMTILKQDWQELTELLQLGEFTRLSARHGQYLQIRPKAATGAALVRGITASGEATKTVAKGFYLRSLFTKVVLG